MPRLQTFKALDKHGGPPDFKYIREWNNAIQKMIDDFELMKYAGGVHTEEEERKLHYPFSKKSRFVLCMLVTNMSFF